MNKSDLFRYKNLLLAKQHELTTGKSLAGSISAGGELQGIRLIWPQRKPSPQCRHA